MSMFSNHSEIELEINIGKKARNIPKFLEVKQQLAVLKKIRKENKKYLRRMKMKSQHTKTYETQ